MLEAECFHGVKQDTVTLYAQDFSRLVLQRQVALLGLEQPVRRLGGKAVDE